MRTWNTSFQKIKSLLQKALLKPLRYYNRNKPVTLQCDPSLKGLWACIIQDGHPIAFVSKSLSDTETWYANIKRELLAIVYSCEKFNTYLYRRTFLVETGHKPLEMISMKNLIAAPVRLQRMLLWPQRYDMTITYRPGKQMLLAGALSHFPSCTDTQIKLDLRVYAISISAFTRSCLIKIAAETQWDPILWTVHRLTLNGWPTRCTNIPESPETTGTSEMNSQLRMIYSWKVNESSSHHPAETLSWMITTKATQESTRHWHWLEHVYWSGMEADVTDYIKRCLMCIESSNLPVETLHPYKVPSVP